MSTEAKRKPGSGPKVQPVQTASKATYKQKSILDSFKVKATPKTPVSNPSPQQVTEVVDLQTTTRPHDETSITSSQSKEHSQSIPVPSAPTQVVDLTALSDVDTEKEAAEMKNGRRSPSITILDADLTPEIDISTYTTSVLKEKPQIMATEGHTPEQPIIIPSSPIKGPTVNKANFHPFFASRPKLNGLSVRPLTSKSKTAALPGRDPPYPTSEAQHIKGPQTVFQGNVEPSLKRWPMAYEKIPAQKMDYSFLKGADTALPEPNNTWIYQAPRNPNEPTNPDVPLEHTLNHPAISRLVNDGQDSLPQSTRPWSEKWRPSCAQEVLGNERSALYLRNWLRALELQLGRDNTEPSAVANIGSKDTKGKSKSYSAGTKRARVVRAVEKRRKRSRLDSDEEDDSWIVDTDESEEEFCEEEKRDFSDLLLPEIPASLQSSTARETLPLFPQDTDQDLGQLHNTILLSGPSGSGKTACVYACTEELGWDVFEVYPGVGRRNGANVDNLVGEVGKNHLVLQSRRNGDVMKTFLSQKNKTEAEDEPLKSYNIASYSPRKKSAFNDDLEPRDSDSLSRPVRQSLILLEEVDILYKEDVNFWTTVIQLIKECKRPVICTCNDISLVPVQELPLQTVIHFEPCSADIGLSYLQALCSVEGYPVGRDVLSRFFATSFPDHAAEPLESSTKIDLRRTLNNLQMRCTTTSDLELIQGHIGNEGPLDAVCNPEENSPEAHPLSGQAKPRVSMKKSEFLSFLDSQLIGDTSGHVTETELASYMPSGDDEIGHRLLYDIYAADKLEFGHRDRHEDMIYSAIELSTRLFDVDVRESDRSGKLVEEMSKRSRYEQVTVLKEICPAATWTRGLWREYVPYIRQMIESEDMAEAREMEKRGTKGRRTRNSGRSEYIRTILVSGEGRRMVSDSGFNIVEGA